MTTLRRTGQPCLTLGRVSPAQVLVLLLLVAVFDPAVGASCSEDNKLKEYALIYGTVYAPDGRTVYGVKVKIRRVTEHKARWELYSDHAGEFAQRVPPGKQDYIVWADLKGWKSAAGKKFAPPSEVRVHVENDERIDISLHLK